MTKSVAEIIALPERFKSEEFAEFVNAVLASKNSETTPPEDLEIVKYFDGMSESDRKKHAKFAYDFFRYVEREYFTAPWERNDEYDENGVLTGITGSPSKRGRLLHDVWLQSKVAVIATASWSTLKEVNWFGLSDGMEAVLRSRRPEWTLDFLEKIIGRIELHSNMAPYWELYRRFRMEGIVGQRRCDSITELMFAVLSGSRYSEKWKREKGEAGSSVVTGLKNDSGLIENELWGIFEIETFRRNWCYTTHDRFHVWKNAFCELIAEGTIPAARVIDGCFNAMNRPLFTDHHVKWFVQLLELLIEKLPITDVELTADARFLELLEHRHANPRGLGLKVFERVLNSGKLELAGMAARLNLVLREPAKAKPKKALGFLKKIAQKNPALREEVFAADLKALEHEAVEIQEAALDLLLEFSALDVPGVREQLEKTAPLLASSVRRKIPGGDAKKEISATKKPLVVAHPPTIHREPIAPIKTFEELLDAAVILLESANDRDEIDRFLDGISRLGSKKPEGFEEMTAPLLKRAIKMLGTSSNLGINPKYLKDKNARYLAIFPPFTGESIAADCFYLILSWLGGELPKCATTEYRNRFHGNASIVEMKFRGKTWVYVRDEGHREECPAYWIFTENAESIAKQVLAGISRPRLSAPTHRGGWIDPGVFVHRLIEAKKSKIAHEDIDRVLGILRLDFKGRPAALKKLDAAITAPEEYIKAVRFALGAEKCKIGKTAHYWVAAARTRSPFEDFSRLEKTFPGLGPDAGTAAVYSIEKTKKHDFNVRCGPLAKKKTKAALFPSIALHSPNTIDNMDAKQENDWKLNVWPGNPDPAIGAAVAYHYMYADDNIDTGFIPYIEIMQQGDIAINKIGAAAIFLAMAATDTMIIAISQGRLDSEKVVAAVREIIATGWLVHSRWLNPLATVTAESPLHADSVRRILEGIVPSLDSKILGGFLELLYEILVANEWKLSDLATIEYLGSIKESGKAAKSAKKISGLS